MKTAEYAQFKMELEAMMPSICAPSGSCLMQIRQQLIQIQKLLDHLNSDMRSTGFDNEDDEIGFFKKVKPRYSAAKSFLISKYGIEVNKPPGEDMALRLFYESELQLVEREIQQLAAYREYERSESTEMDTYWFTRKAGLTTLLTVGIIGEEHSFDTLGSRLYCKLYATEMLWTYLMICLKGLKSDQAIKANETNYAGLRWTGEKVNLVEVIYALHFTGQFNNGNADLSQIIAFMEKQWQVDLSRTYRDFIDIRNRKASSPTRFIEAMRESIHKRIEDDLALKPVKNRPPYGR